MNYLEIRNAIRKLVIGASGINPETHFRHSGITLDTRNMTLWLEEEFIGGEMRPLSNQRLHTDTFILQYNFCIPAGGNTDEIENKVAMAEDAVSPGTIICTSESDCLVRRTKINRSSNKEISMTSLVVTLAVSSTGKS